MFWSIIFSFASQLDVWYQFQMIPSPCYITLMTADRISLTKPKEQTNKQTKETLFKSWQWLTCVCVWATELVHTNLWSAVKFNHDFKKGKQRLQTGSSSLFPLKHKSANLDTNWPNHNTFIMDISLNLESYYLAMHYKGNIWLHCYNRRG